MVAYRGGSCHPAIAPPPGIWYQRDNPIYAMLTSLRVQDLALAHDVRVDAEAGLNVITGETGAGKSILLGALGLLLGDRAEKGLIRSGQPECRVEAAFQLEAEDAVNAVLKASGLDPCEDGLLVIRRVLKASGANAQFVNGSPTTLQVLKQIGDLLVDMHGPHDHQSLLQPSAQLALLDAFGDASALRSAYVAAWSALESLEAEREALEATDGSMLAEQMDLLRFRVEEIEAADLSEEDEEAVRQEHELLGHAEQVRADGATIVQALEEGEGNAAEALAAALRGLQGLRRHLPEGEAWFDALAGLTGQIRELSLEISRRLGDIEANPARLAELDQRLATYSRLKRKYGPAVSDVLAKGREARERLESLAHREERLTALGGEIAKAEAAVRKAGLALHKRRLDTAGRLARGIVAELRALGLTHGGFEVALHEEETPGPSGLDRVEFGFQPNAGEPMQPLRKIASSGEISRVMLAVKTVLARHDRVPVLVFDEVDANVGGEIAHTVGAKLAEVARSRQVLCITHLPQVAVWGGTHFAVRKEVRDGRTESQVARLDPDDREEEIARMLGGRDLTRSTLQHARELLSLPR